MNASVMEARYLPCVDLIDNMRLKKWKKMILKRRQFARLKGVIVPMADRYIKDISKNLNVWL